MYLKALEIQGFKSFPDKTVLTFDCDITAIVGPNGSGKSNISDAIRWVMGEMSSKNLRGGKMEDVIFGGTMKRPQVGFAEVSLIIDNASGFFPMDTAEVMVTRRYFRSGESEYYINKQSARLKDIVELFMDTGLGREGYSQIGQGKIDEIISVKSVERREVFEEAAGISKYRHRKEESERKLSAAQDNLVRIGDKIAELELTVGPLREQAEKAKKYLVLRDELRGLEVTVWLDNLSKQKSAAAKAVSDYETSRAQSEGLQRALERLYADSEAVTGKMRACDADTEAKRAEAAALEAEAAELESAIAVAHTNMENNESNLEKLRKDLSEQEDRSGGITAQLEARKKRIADIGAEIAQKERARTETAKQAEALSAKEGSLGEKIDALKAAQSEKLAEASKRETELSALAGSLQELFDRDTAIGRELAALLEKKAQSQADQDKCLTALSEAEDKAAGLKNTVSGYELRLKGRSEKAEALGQKLMKLTVDKQSLKGRIEMLSEMEREYEGYNKSVRMVMTESEKGRLRNIRGPVSKLLRVPDKYTVAIETALGASLQNIVVDTEEDGKSAIELLKRRDGGRATFLPMSAVRGSRLNENGLDGMAGFEGVGSDLIEYNRAYEGIFHNLLGRTVVAEDMDSAVKMARKFSHRFRIVTLDGQLINAGGSMTGGSVAAKSGILSRANELKRLTAQYELLESDYVNLQRDADEAKRQAAAVEYELMVAGDELRAAQDEVLRLSGDKGMYELLLQSLGQSESALRAEGAGLQKRMSDSNQKIEILRNEAAALKSEAEALGEKAAALLGDAAELMSRNKSLSDALAAIRTAQAALEAEKAATENGIAELQSLHLAISGDREQSLRVEEELVSRSLALKNQIEDLKTKLGWKNRSCEEAKADLRKLIDHKLQLEGERARLDKAAQEKNRDLLTVERETARLEQKKAAAEMEEKLIIDKLWDSYELTVTSAEKVRLEDISPAKAGKRIGEIKREMNALGTPNIGAIEEFERINARYEFLAGQRSDIETAKAELEKIIDDITDEMKTIFAQRFRLINDSFTATFTEIFGGGRGELVLENADDILNCGIEIRVQPPGKQVKTITLLSGGEKAFVAIALYFAILKVSPTPFCVLDEIDAALDDSNVSRFAGYLRKLSDKTQFIVITHRRGTMEEADVLYGVTMQEQGVSKMLTLDLNKMSQQLNVG